MGRIVDDPIADLASFRPGIFKRDSGNASKTALNNSTAAPTAKRGSKIFKKPTQSLMNRYFRQGYFRKGALFPAYTSRSRIWKRVYPGSIGAWKLKSFVNQNL